MIMRTCKGGTRNLDQSPFPPLIINTMIGGSMKIDRDVYRMAYAGWTIRSNSQDVGQ
jgi:hypothetical protein